MLTAEKAHAQVGDLRHSTFWGAIRGARGRWRDSRLPGDLVVTVKVEVPDPPVMIFELHFPVAPAMFCNPSELRVTIVIDRGINVPLWQDVSRGLWDQKPQFVVKPPAYVTAAISDFVRSRLSPSAAR